MQKGTKFEPITEDDAFIARALESASVPALLTSLVHLTGDIKILDRAPRPNQAVLGEIQGAMSRSDKDAARALALEVITDFRDRGCPAPAPPSPDTIHRMMNFMVGEEVSADYIPMMREELAIDGQDARDIDWSSVPKEAREKLPVLIIGAGMSGILAAIRLEAAGVPYQIVEKNAGVGGTWLENTYPGCRVDIANHFYCYSFEPNNHWSEFFAQHGELRRYFENCTDRYKLRDNIRFNTEVVEARFDEEKQDWVVKIRESGASTEGDTGEQTLRARAIISAVGQLSRPRIPEIPGLKSFPGASFHSARWDHSCDLAGKRVAVVGTGASALQLVPEIAKTAGELAVFQRSAAWVVPNPNYHRSVSDEKKWLLNHLPGYARWYRFLLFWPGSDGLMPTLEVDPDWPHPERSVNALNEQQRILFTAYIESQIRDHPELRDKVVPSYPPFGKRMLQDNGGWLAALQRDNVTLVASAVSSIDGNKLTAENGEEFEADVIVFATGFHANKFLWPMRIVGRDGAVLSEVWGENPEAYLGITVPKFPNLFCLYGPATNLAHAGSIIFHSECQVRYILGCLRALAETGAHALECRQEVHDAFNERLQARHRGLVWSHPGVTSWYKNREGKVTTTSPWLLLDYWRWTREPDLEDYEIS